MIKPRWPLLLQITTVLLAATVLGALAINELAYARALSQQEANSSEQDAALLRTLSDAKTTSDDALVAVLNTALETHSSLHELTLSRPDQQTLNAARLSSTPSSLKEVMHDGVIGQGQPFTLTLTRDLSAITKRARHTARSLSIGSFLLLLTFTILAVALSYLFAVRPITRIQKDLDALSHEHLGSPTPLPATAARDFLRLHRVVGDLLHQQEELLTAQTSLKKACDEAMDAARAKSEFLATMSHEIRTPMNGVMGTLELLTDTQLSREQADYTDTARRSAESLLEIINDILDFSKIEAGKLTLESNAFALHELVEDVASGLANIGHAKGVEVACHVQEDVPATVRGDALRLRQVLINLLSNALKFTSEGEIVVGASKAGEDADGRAIVRFEVRDTGLGIPEERLAGIFDAFTQADSSTTRRFGGTGLGLAIARRLSEAMGGEIGVDSVVDQGSCFWFTACFERSGEITQIPRAPNLAGLHCLIVDDNATNRTILEHFMKKWKITSESAVDGAHAWRILQDARAENRFFDFALLDYQMPNMNGLELAKQIHEEKSYRPMQLIMLSSLGHPGEAATKVGISRSLTKPVRRSQLQETLHTVLQKRDEPRPNARNQVSKLPQLSGSILLAEDNATNQKVQLAMLKKMGLTAELAENGKAALQAVQETRFDLILMDAQMPEMDGLEATRQIRAWERAQNVPAVAIVALTANAMQGDRERCLEAGMTDYLTKPVKRSELSRVLQDLLAKSPQAHAEHAVS